MRRVIVILGLSAGLLAPVELRGAELDVKIHGATLADVRVTLFGLPAGSGLIGRGQAFDAKFDQMALTAQDAPQLLTLVRDVLQLPPRSEVKIEGTIDRARFKAMVERSKSGHAEIKVEGLTFADSQQMLAFLETVTHQGAKECKVRGFIGQRPIEVKLKQEVVKAR